MHFGDVSETNVRNTPRQSRSAHAFVFTKKKKQKQYGSHSFGFQGYLGTIAEVFRLITIEM